MKNSLHKNQSGITSVEFAICAAVYFLVLFGVIEAGRLMFTMNALDEVTRRGARLASVCPVTQNAQVANTAIFGGTIVSGLLPEHVDIAYLQSDFTPIADPVAGFENIIYVRVRIVGFTHRLLIPLFVQDLTPPPFSTTVLAESLGIIPPPDADTPSGLSSC